MKPSLYKRLTIACKMVYISEQIVNDLRQRHGIILESWTCEYEMIQI